MKTLLHPNFFIRRHFGPLKTRPKATEPTTDSLQARPRRQGRRSRLAAGMIKRFFAPTALLFIGLAFGSCTPFAGFISDRWPTWAGGMPKDVPPRPGAAGYEEFMAHQQGKDAAAAGSPEANANAQTAPSGAPAEKASARATPSGNQPPNGQGAVQGGLY
jgi:hypothetical protein